MEYGGESGDGKMAELGLCVLVKVGCKIYFVMVVEGGEKLCTRTRVGQLLGG